jgi:hypothetical protein
MKLIPAIWLIFTILFSCFSVYHFKQLDESFPRFEWATYLGWRGGDFFSPSAIETRHNLENFIKEWNKYIGQQNATSFRINLIAAIAYLITACMSFIAMVLPGPYNIKDTANYLYENYTKAKGNIHTVFVRHTNPNEKREDENKT